MMRGGKGGANARRANGRTRRPISLGQSRNRKGSLRTSHGNYQIQKGAGSGSIAINPVVSRGLRKYADDGASVVTREARSLGEKKAQSKYPSMALSAITRPRKESPKFAQRKSEGSGRESGYKIRNRQQREESVRR